MKLSPLSRTLVLMAAVVALVTASWLSWRRYAGGGQPPGSAIRLGDTLCVYSTPLYVIEDRGLWTSNGVEVAVTTFTSGRLALDALVAGQLDVAFAAPTPILYALLAGHGDLRIIGTVTTTDTDTKVVYRTDRGIQTPSDLRGKRIGVLMGSVSEYFTTLFLSRAGLAPKDVTLVNLRPEDMPPAFENGSVDAFVIWEPYIHQTQKRSGRGAGVFVDRSLLTTPWLVVSRKSVVDARADSLAAFLKAFRDATAYIPAHRAEAISATAHHIGMGAEDLDRIWDCYTFKTGLWPGLRSLLSQEGKWTATRAGRPEFSDSLLDGLLDAKCLERAGIPLSL